MQKLYPAIILLLLAAGCTGPLVPTPATETPRPTVTPIERADTWDMPVSELLPNLRCPIGWEWDFVESDFVKDSWNAYCGGSDYDYFFWIEAGSSQNNPPEAIGWKDEGEQADVALKVIANDMEIPDEVFTEIQLSMIKASLNALMSYPDYDPIKVNMDNYFISTRYLREEEMLEVIITTK